MTDALTQSQQAILDGLSEAQRQVLLSVARTDFLSVVTSLVGLGLVERDDDGLSAAFRLTPLGLLLRTTLLQANRNGK